MGNTTGIHCCHEPHPNPDARCGIMCLEYAIALAALVDVSVR